MVMVKPVELDMVIGSIPCINQTKPSISSGWQITTGLVRGDKNTSVSLVYSTYVFSLFNDTTNEAESTLIMGKSSKRYHANMQNTAGSVNPNR